MYNAMFLVFQSVAATGGIDRIVRLWNPYVVTKPISVGATVSNIPPCNEDEFFKIAYLGAEGS